MSAIWESANWTRQFGIRQTGNRQFGIIAYNNYMSSRYYVCDVFIRIKVVMNVLTN